MNNSARINGGARRVLDDQAAMGGALSRFYPEQQRRNIIRQRRETVGNLSAGTVFPARQKELNT